MALKRTTRSEHSAPKKVIKERIPSAKKDAAKKGTLPSKKGVSKKTSTTPAIKGEPSKSYKELIVEALIALEDRTGSSRPAIKKYIKENYPNVGVANGFDLYFNNAVKKGVETNDFELPKGPSGALKLVKKTPATAEKMEIEKKGKKPETRVRFPKSTNGKVESKSPKSEEDSKRNRGRPKSSETGAKNEEIKSNETNVKQARPRASEKSKVKKLKSQKVEKHTKTKVPSPTYKEMIISGILQLNDGRGSSRPALKKFVKDQYKKTIKSGSNFDHLFNTAIKKGIESGDFHQPKGPSGVVKVLKKKNLQMQSIAA